MDMKQRDTLIKKILEATAKVTPTDKLKDKISEKGRMVLALMEKSDFGCYTKQVRELTSILLGEELPETREKSAWPFERFQAVVTIGNPNSHNYIEEQVALIYQDGATVAVRRDGTLGNNLPTTRKNLRPATPAEITDLPNEQLEAFVKRANVVFI